MDKCALVTINWRGKPLSVTHADGTAETFEYEGNGRRVTRHVDALGREDVYKWTLGIPIHAGRVVGGVTNNLFGVEHDKQLNVVAITDPSDARRKRTSSTRTSGSSLSRTWKGRS